MIMASSSLSDAMENLRDRRMKVTSEEEPLPARPDQEADRRHQDRGVLGSSSKQASQGLQGHQSDLADHTSAANQTTESPKPSTYKPSQLNACLIRLEGVLSDPEIARVATGPEKAPEVTSRRNEQRREEQFCRLD